MAAMKHILAGSAMPVKPSLVVTKSTFLSTCEKSSLSFSGSFLLPREKKRVRCPRVGKMVVAPVVATISERLVKVAPQRPMVEFTVRATMTVRRNKKEDIKEKIANHFDAIGDMVGRNVVLELVSTEIDPWTKKSKRSRKAVVRNWFEKRRVKGEKVVYTVEFAVDSSFGTPGAIIVTNRHQKEFFLETIAVEGFVSGTVHFNCHSWVQPISGNSTNRVFFSDKPYLPSETPAGLRKMRQEELRALRGDGTGELKPSDRIYDYDTYNDLGNPDKGIDWKRPNLGGKNLPYPRRCRTGRPPTTYDPECESRVEAPLPIYVPRDEVFEESKQEMLDEGQAKAMLHVLVPSLVATSEECHDMEGFHQMDSLYKAEVQLKQGLQSHILKKFVPFFSKFQEAEASLRYDTPSILTKDRFAWLRDDEFARQTVAGINPVSIEKVQVFPPVSKLDPEVYGQPESAIKEEHIIGHLDGMSVQQAMEEKKLFMLDYHDLYLPFLDRINAQPGRKAYATRTIFFLTSLGTLKPIAIELCLPPGTAASRSKRVLTPPVDATTSWLWQLAKSHVCSNDAGIHQLINHWLRTHACMEPFIIASHRQLSTMHPIFKLLQPHMRYTLQINALARQILISGNGVIESFFTPGSVSMHMSAVAYRDYCFDQENLPADLIRRGMAEPDPTKPEGVRLIIEDYPYASDGLMIWSAIQNWVTIYVNVHYSNDATVESDVELQSWYSEAINVGHEDIRHSTSWPRLSTVASLIKVLTTIIWLSSAQHAALNFAQYPFGGYMPNRPPLMRRLIPEETDPEYKNFLADPEKFFMSSLPSLMQATKLMTVIDTLSTHSVDEEYLGERGKQTYSWTPEIAEAFNEFAAEIRRVEAEIERKNCDTKLRNRCGAGVLPYELLMPSSGPGITCRGVPNSVSI